MEAAKTLSRVLVEHLKLETKPHLLPYTLGWIENGPSLKVMDLCHVPILIGEFYQDFVACDVVDMEKCQFFGGDHGNMILMQSTRVERTSICSLGRAKELPRDQLYLFPGLQKKRSLNSYQYAIEADQDFGVTLFLR